MMWPFIPACKDFCRSSSKALAEKAMIFNLSPPDDNGGGRSKSGTLPPLHGAQRRVILHPPELVPKITVAVTSSHSYAEALARIVEYVAIAQT